MKKFLFLFFLFPALAFSQAGTFSVALTTTDSIVYDVPGAYMSVHGTIYNLSATDSVKLSMEKQFVDIPGDWETAICTDVCYPSSVSYIEVSIAPADSQEFVFYFYTYLTADSGYAKILYNNLNVSGNSVLQGYAGVTQDFTGIKETESPGVSIFPNPALEFIEVHGVEDDIPFLITDIIGKPVQKGHIRKGQTTLSIAALPPGTYVFVHKSGSGVRFIKK